MPGSREGHLEEPPGLHVGRVFFSPPKAQVLIFHEKHGIVLAPLELMHRHDADAGCLPVIVDDLVLEYRFVQRGLGTLVVAILLPEFRQPLFDCRSPTQEAQIARMLRRTFGFIGVVVLKRSSNRTPVLCRRPYETDRADRLERGGQGTTLASLPGR